MASTILTFITHSIATGPSLIHHSVKTAYDRYYATSIPNFLPLSNQNVILFVHGRNGRHTDFNPLIDNIQKIFVVRKFSIDNYDIDCILTTSTRNYHLRTIDLGPTAHTTIDQDAKTLSAHINKVYQNCYITLVGLSKGGVTVMRYLTNNNSDNNIIQNVITISSPLRGTMIADLLGGSVAENLGNANPILRQIEEKSKKIQKTKIHHIVPTWDQLIIPASNARYENTPDSQIYHYQGMRYSHSGIAYCPDVARKIVEWVQ